MAGVSDIAANFEKENPGWIVVAAVNGDFFQINSTYEKQLKQEKTVLTVLCVFDLLLKVFNYDLT